MSTWFPLIPTKIALSRNQSQRKKPLWLRLYVTGDKIVIVLNQKPLNKDLPRKLDIIDIKQNGGQGN